MMAKIHGLVYIVVGLLVSSISWKINYDKLYLFFYAGLLFILVGIYRLIFKSEDKKQETKQQTHRKILPQHINAMRHQAQRYHYKKCARCGNIARVHDNFCSRCGARV